MLTVKSKPFFFKGADEELNAAPVIYKLQFDNGKFYIGATDNLLQRYKAYTSNFRTGFFESKNLILAFNGSESATMEVLKKCSEIDVLEWEKRVISEYLGNPNLINRSTGGNANEGIRWTDEERQNMSQRMKRIPNSIPPKFREVRKVYCETLSLIFDSTYKAAMALDVCQSKVSSCCQGKSLHAKGFTFRYIANPEK